MKINEKYYGLILKAGIIALLSVWVALIVFAAILISTIWIKVSIIVVIVLIPIILIVIWIFKNYSGPQ